MVDRTKKPPTVQDGMTCYGVAPDATTKTSNTLRVGIIANQDSSLPLGSDIAKAVQQANRQLQKITGIQLALTELCYKHFGRFDATAAVPSPVTPAAMMTNYIETTRADLPDYVVVLATDQMSSDYGGYQLAPYGITRAEQKFLSIREPNFCQRASSEAYDNRPVIYGTVIQGVHPYGGCGDVVGNDGEHHALHEYSEDGQCCNQDGLRCVTKNNLTFCPGDEKKSHAQPVSFLASTIVHELGHSFGFKGADDHYAMACAERGAIPPNSIPGVTSRFYAEICPDVWARLRSGALSCLLPEVMTSLHK